MRRIAALVTASAALAFIPATSGATASPPIAAISKTCSGGYTHGVIGGSHKCLRRGQYCARSRDRDYHRYGYHCHRYSGGGYRLR